jgi:hypothetical protein
MNETQTAAGLEVRLPNNGHARVCVGSRLIRVEKANRVGCEWISRGCKGAGTRAAAKRTVIADAATIFELRRIVELAEKRGIAVHVHNMIFADIADG